jgi:DNA-binding PucR family transcriptional regulator
VVYRLDQLRELLGVDLDDPGQRFRLRFGLIGLRLLD